MSLVVVKLRDGFLVQAGKDVLIRGLREKTDAFKIRHDILRKGFFRGVVTFARNGARLEVTVPADADVARGREEPLPPWLVQRTQRDTEGTVDDL